MLFSITLLNTSKNPSGYKNSRIFIQVFPYMSLNCLALFFTHEPKLWRLHLLDMLFTGVYNLDHVLKNKLFLRIKNTTKIDIFPLLITYLKISFLHVIRVSWRIKHYRNRSLHGTYQNIQKYKFLLRVRFDLVVTMVSFYDNIDKNDEWKIKRIVESIHTSIGFGHNKLCFNSSGRLVISRVQWRRI